MNIVTYQTYLNDPAVREELDREVRRLRNEAVTQYIVVPVLGAFSRMFGLRPTTRPSVRPMPTSVSLTS
jgi:hypothetical protein